MKRIIFVSFFILFSVIEIFAQDRIGDIMLVNATLGLRVRNSPSLNSDRIGLLNYLTEVRIIEEDSNIVNIDGIEGKWVLVHTNNIEGWIFDGYLITIDDRRRMFVGDWLHPYEISTFLEGGRFERSKLESDYSGYGRWAIIDNRLIITITNINGFEREANVNYRGVFDFSFVDGALLLTVVSGEIFQNPDSLAFIRFDRTKDVWEQFRDYGDRFYRQ
jgi:hypothetical protein